MITLNEIADNIYTMMYPNTLDLEGAIPKRQIKHWIHYHRARLIYDNIDKGILANESIIQIWNLNSRISTYSRIQSYMNDWDDYNSGVTSTAPTPTSGYG